MSVVGVACLLAVSVCSGLDAGSTGPSCGPLLAGRLAALASMRQLRRSSVGESPDVVMSSSMDPGQSSRQAVHGRVRHRALAAAAGLSFCNTSSRASLLPNADQARGAAGLEASSSQSFQQQGQCEREERCGGASQAAGVITAAAVAPTGSQHIGSPIEGLGALRRSLSQLPVGPRPASASASASLRHSVSEERLPGQTASQQQLTLEEQASLVLGRLLCSNTANGNSV